MGFQPQLWVDPAGEALTFYRRAFGANVLHLVGDGNDIVAQLGVYDGAFWIAPPSADMGRRTPADLGATTGRVLLVVADPVSFVATAVDAGATLTSAVGEEHGWLLGRITDPYGHEWEIGHPLGD